MCLSAAERGAGPGNAADGFFGGVAAGRGKLDVAGTAVQGGTGADLTADSLIDRTAFRAELIEAGLAFPVIHGGVRADLAGDSKVDGMAVVLRKVDTVAGAAVKRRMGADLTVDGLIDNAALVVMLTHTLLLVFLFPDEACCLITSYRIGKNRQTL